MKREESGIEKTFATISHESFGVDVDVGATLFFRRERDSNF